MTGSKGEGRGEEGRRHAFSKSRNPRSKSPSPIKKNPNPLAKFKKLFTFANEMQQGIMNFTPKYRPLVPDVALAAAETLPTPPLN
jgi:hypothetical protein